MAGNIKAKTAGTKPSLSIPDEERMSRGSLSMAWWAICSAMFWLVVSATLAMNFGTINALIGDRKSVV